MQIILNASNPGRAKLHMEATWVFLTRHHGEAEREFKFREFAVVAVRQPDGAVHTRERAY